MKIVETGKKEGKINHTNKKERQEERERGNDMKI